MKDSLLEKNLAPTVARFLDERNFSNKKEEMPFFEHRIDMYGVSELGEKSVAIEMKLYKWRKALAQAMVYQTCSDFAYVALLDNTVKNIDMQLFEHHGVGVISVSIDGNYSVVLEAEQSIHKVSSFAGRFEEVLRRADANQ